MVEIYYNDYGMLKLKAKRKVSWFQAKLTWFKQRFFRNRARDMYLKM